MTISGEACPDAFSSSSGPDYRRRGPDGQVIQMKNLDGSTRLPGLLAESRRLLMIVSAGGRY